MKFFDEIKESFKSNKQKEEEHKDWEAYIDKELIPMMTLKSGNLMGDMYFAFLQHARENPETTYKNYRSRHGMK